MATLISAISPEDAATDVPLNAEVVFNIVDVAGINLNSLDVVLDNGILLEEPIVNGIFSNGFNGEYIDNAPGSILSDVTVVIVRPSDKPEYQQGQNINVDIDVNSTNFTYSFITQTFQFIFPTMYSEELILTSLPGGYTIQTSGTGTAPTYSLSGMITNPNVAGTSFIKKNAAGLDFESGVLFDMIVSAIVPGKVKILQLSSNEQGMVSVEVDFSTHEIWLNGIISPLPTDFRPGIKGDTVFFRLSIKGVQDNLIARLYSGKEDSVDPYLLKQTGGPSVSIPSSVDSIEIGSIDSGNTNILVKSCKILLNENPDAYYPFPQISNIFPTSDELSGGQTFKLEFANDIDIGAGSELLFTDNVMNNESVGAAGFTVKSGLMTLSTTGIGSAAVRMLRSYSGDLPSGASVSVDVEVDANIVANPPQNEVILAAMEMRASGIILAIEMASNIIDRAFFRAKLITSGVLTLNKKLITTQKNNFTIKMVRAGNQIQVSIGGVSVINTSFKDGPGIIRFYNKTITDRSIDTKISNFTVRPVVVIGDSIVNV